MSAVPKKKLCWNCEGNVSREIDNCPYCGVYLHASEEEDSDWNPSYRSSSKTEEIPSPLYQIQQENEIDQQESSHEKDLLEENEHSFALTSLFTQLKQDIFPILFLMAGSIFFLFGVVLVLFSQNGTFTLQWQERDGIYFLLVALPLIGFGWRFLQQLETSD
jgi:magnesium-transporting ATPase (P-type)